MCKSSEVCSVYYYYKYSLLINIDWRHHSNNPYACSVYIWVPGFSQDKVSTFNAFLAFQWYLKLMHSQQQHLFLVKKKWKMILLRWEIHVWITIIDRKLLEIKRERKTTFLRWNMFKSCKWSTRYDWTPVTDQVLK